MVHLLSCVEGLPASEHEQLVLTPGDGELECHGVELEIAPGEDVLGLGLHERGVQDPAVRGTGAVVAPGELRASSDLLDQSHLGLEEVHVQPQVSIELCEHIELGRGVVAQVADLLANDREVLLLDEAVVVLALGS